MLTPEPLEFISSGTTITWLPVSKIISQPPHFAALELLTALAIWFILVPSPWAAILLVSTRWPKESQLWKQERIKLSL